jgi:hypothetical protein
MRPNSYLSITLNRHIFYGRKISLIFNTCAYSEFIRWLKVVAVESNEFVHANDILLVTLEIDFSLHYYLKSFLVDECRVRCDLLTSICIRWYVIEDDFTSRHDHSYICRFFSDIPWQGRMRNSIDKYDDMFVYSWSLQQ